MLPKSSEKRNKSDVNNLNKFLTTYDGDLKCMGDILEVVQEKRKHVAPIVYALHPTCKTKNGALIYLALCVDYHPYFLGPSQDVTFLIIIGLDSLLELWTCYSYYAI